MATQAQAFEQAFHDEQAVWLRWGDYEAAVLPNVGANLIAFRDNASGFRFLREPSAAEMNGFRANPGIHGIPVLFPPNRYEDGTFTWNGRTYTFPVNEAKTGNHLHGFFHTAVWSVEDFGTNKSESYVSLKISIDETHPIYQYLPHRFTIKLRYALNETGLLQHVSVHNEGTDAMPCMIAFHTTVNAPFAPGSTSDDCRFTLTTGKRWELSERMLPTGKHQPLKPEEEAMKTTGISPFWEPMDNHYTTQPQNGRNAMELTDTRIGVTLVYDIGTAYKQWMIWNNNATPGFFCPEPQLNLVNAPNVDLPADEIGLVALEPGGIWEETSRLYVRKQA
ncbi:aldose 1-epimerase [Paenibacillus arenilitoris]|uniref:Aldose 1-epimerase n=1 Tax=Paenibacillus arenilitoris TaxID=2772299 RepID=A0A927CGX9_9BACL|nr:aldose 1-epimerase [Paenibacillus arenilitoris]MBD2867898.1 aldose 1-epimerase [Paenibacillus arenilitoris]